MVREICLRLAGADRGESAAKGSTLLRLNRDWKVAKTYTEITYRKAGDVAKVTINRSEVFNPVFMCLIGGLISGGGGDYGE